MESTSILSENHPRPKIQAASPLMFESDDEDTLVNDSACSSNKENANESTESTTEPSKEEKILKGFQTVMMGIPPPPAFTVPQLDCREILKLWRENQAYRIALSPGKSQRNKDFTKKLEEEVKNTKWPDVLKIDHWDIYYNKSATSEELERLSVRYKERYVGVETSSCINALFVKSPFRTASARKRARNRAWGHSPGRRLSHLARRRKAFSSASLCSVAGNNNPDKKMIMVEIKKIGNRHKRKSSAKKRKPTPKKKVEPQASTYKRALFQSPDQNPMNAASKTPSSQCIQRSKRNLFSDSSEKKNEFGKRERPALKRISPRKRVNRSLSFHESSQPPAAPLPRPTPSALVTQATQVLTGAHKQKMLWAATNALREEGMGMSHDLFRPCMTVLFRTCQRLWMTRVAKQEVEGSTSERMLSLAKQFSAYTIKEISSDCTSEHMALVYNNSIKIGEDIFSQQSVVTSKESTSGSANIKYDSANNRTHRNEETEGSRTHFDDSCKVNKDVGKTSADFANSLGVINGESKYDNNTRTPNKKTHETESSSITKHEYLINPKVKLHRLSKVNFNVRQSPRSDPDTNKTSCDVNAQGSKCKALFPTEEGSDKLEIPVEIDGKSNPASCIFGEQVQNKDEPSLQMNKNENEDSSVHSEGQTENSIIRDSDPSPLKGRSKDSESPRGCHNSKTSCEVNGKSVVINCINSPAKILVNNTFLDKKNVNDSSGSSFDNIEVKGKSNMDNKKVCERSDSLKCESNNDCKSKEFDLQHKQTCTKKVSFSSTQPLRSCLSTRRKSCDVKVNLSSPNRYGNKDQSSVLENNNTANNDVNAVTPSKVRFQVTESLGARRVTRSKSAEIKVAGSPINHLFSPPLAQNQKLFGSQDYTNEIPKPIFKSSQASISDTQPTTGKNTTLCKNLPNKALRVTRRTSCDLKSSYSNNSDASSKGMPTKEGSNNILNSKMYNNERSSHTTETTPSKFSRRSSQSTKNKIASRRISCETKSINSDVSVVLSSSSQNGGTENGEPVTSPPEFISPITRLRKAASKRRTSFVSSEGSSSKSNTPSKSVCSEEYSADTENSTSTIICGSEISVSQRSNNSAEQKSDGDYETNKENLGDHIPAIPSSNKIMDNVRNSTHTHLLAVENTPNNQIVPEEPVNRMLQLYRLSTSSGDELEREKLIPDIVCLEPPKLMPHWEANECESEETLDSRESPPALAPHWELESCSGTSTSLPESIMAHWQQMSTNTNENTSDKVMFDFEDTSYEITFPSANEDSRASSICAPFDYPLLIDDSKSGFCTMLRKNSTESDDSKLS